MPTQDIDAMTRVITVTDIHADVADAMTCLIYMHLLFFSSPNPFTVLSK